MLPDMSDEAKARRAQMTKLARGEAEKHRITRPAQPDGSEVDRIAARLGIAPGATVFMCNRGRR